MQHWIEDAAAELLLEGKVNAGDSLRAEVSGESLTLIRRGIDKGIDKGEANQGTPA